MHKIAPAGVLLGSAVLGLLLISASGKSTAASAAPHFRGGGDGHCMPVGGSVMTNFINADTTLGTASGDLRGAVSASLLGAPQPGPGGSVVFHVQHHWVTETGDTLAIDRRLRLRLPFRRRFSQLSRTRYIFPAAAADSPAQRETLPT